MSRHFNDLDAVLESDASNEVLAGLFRMSVEKAGACLVAFCDSALLPAFALPPGCGADRLGTDHRQFDLNDLWRRGCAWDPTWSSTLSTLPHRWQVEGLPSGRGSR